MQDENKTPANEPQEVVGQYIRDDSLEQPQWTQSYRSKWQYEN